MPTVTTNYFKFHEGGQNVSISADTWIVSLMGQHVNSATSNTLKDHQLWTDVSTYEVTGTGYTSGTALQNAGWFNDDTNNIQKLSASDMTFANITVDAYGVALWRLSDGLIMGFIDFGATPISSLNGNFSITWNANGILNKN